MWAPAIRRAVPRRCGFAQSNAIRANSSRQLASAAAAKANVASNPDNRAFNARNVAGLAVFTAAMYGIAEWFMNYQRRKNLIMDGIMFQLRNNSTLIEELGKNIDLAGMKWVNGEINQLTGIVNVNFEVTGTKGHTAKVAIKMQRYPHDPTKWQTVDFFVSTAEKSWNCYVDDETSELVLKGGN